MIMVGDVYKVISCLVDVDYKMSMLKIASLKFQTLQKAKMTSCRKKILMWGRLNFDFWP